jgi:exportin-2 (importin alpha re-exporter)
MPYVFQILALMLELSPNETSSNFAPILDALLAPKMWDTRGNVPACTRLLCAVMPVAARQVNAEHKLEQILSIFERLILSKKLELYSFDILDTIVRSFQP